MGSPGNANPGIRAHRFEAKAFLGFGLVLAQVFLRDAIQFRQQLHAHNPGEGIFGRHQQRSSFARSQIDEGETGEVGPQSGKHFVKQRWLGGLIGRVEYTQQAVAPADRCAGGIDSMIPVVLNITIAPASLLGRRIAQETPDLSEEDFESRNASLPGSILIPPVAQCVRQAGPVRGGIHQVKSYRIGQEDSGCTGARTMKDRGS